jgi:hypothetical protein
VTGQINAGTLAVQLDPMFVIPDAGDIEPREPGPYAIVLRGPGGMELARYPFTPDEVRDGPALQPPDEVVIEDVNLLAITELVPYVGGTTRVDIEGAGGVLASVVAGPAAPTVAVLSPNGGETLDGDTIPVSWSANDPDGDDLFFNVQYSWDNGQNWEMVAQNLTGNGADLPATNFMAGEQALVRVWASDGIHSSADQSDAPFTVPNRAPEVEISLPMPGETYVISQTVTFEGLAYDVDSGFMDDEQVRWRSNIDGLLGTGLLLSVADLSVGTHTVTCRADDGEGGVATDTVRVTVVEDVMELPPVEDALTVNTDLIVLQPRGEEKSAPLLIDNENAENAIRWRATADKPWVRLGSTAGQTPAEVVVRTNPDQLSGGRHTAYITLTSLDVPGQEVVVRLDAEIGELRLRLPLNLRNR